MPGPDIVVGRCNLLTHYSLQDSDQIDEHDCTIVVEGARPRSDLPAILIHNADLIMFADGSCPQKKNGQLKASYALVTSHEILEAYVLSVINWAPAAESRTVTRAAVLGSGLKGNTYSGSGYVFASCHATGQKF